MRCIIVLGLLIVVFTGCGRFGKQGRNRFPVACDGKPTTDDFLLTSQGDLLLNGKKCKFKFPKNRKPQKMQKKDSEHSQ